MTDSLVTRDTGDPLRKEVRRLLLERLYYGQLGSGASIKETKLAEELGVSRTPLREALLSLQFEGFVEFTKGKGFSVPPLRASTARDLYLLVGWLEGAALRNEGRVTHEQMEELYDLQNRLEQARSESKDDQAVRLDLRWHAVLVNNCSNQEACSTLDLLRQRLYLYEYLVGTRIAATQPTLDGHHREIMEAFEKENPSLAVELVKHHWRTGAETRSRWLEENGPAPKDGGSG